MKYDKETNTVWYSEDEIITFLCQLGNDWEIPEESNAISGEFNYIQFKDHALFEEIFKKFATAKGFRKSIEKAGLVGKDFLSTKTALSQEDKTKADNYVKETCHNIIKDIMMKDYDAKDKSSEQGGKNV